MVTAIIMMTGDNTMSVINILITIMMIKLLLIAMRVGKTLMTSLTSLKMHSSMTTTSLMDLFTSNGPTLRISLMSSKTIMMIKPIILQVSGQMLLLLSCSTLLTLLFNLPKISKTQLCL